MTRRRIMTSGVGAEIGKKLATTGFIHRNENTCTISGQYADGTARADFKLGPYNYSGFAIMVRCNAEIVGKTFEDHGTHYLTTAAIKDYVDTISLELDNSRERHLTVAQLIERNVKEGHDNTDGVLHMRFGGPNIFEGALVTDAYSLGTSNRRALELVFALKSAWADGTMFLEILSEYTPTIKGTQFLNTVVSKRKTVTSAGETTLAGSDFPIHSDIGQIIVVGNKIKSAKLSIDGIVVVEGTNLGIRQLEELYNPDAYAHGNGVVFDFIREGQISKALQSLERQEQRARNADISLTLDMTGAEELQILIDQVGRYETQ